MIAAKKLLVVDDEPVVCQSCSRIFSDRGFLIDTSTSPAQGLRLAANNEYSAILLDIKMPEMDGIEFLEELRKTNQSIPVMMITGYSSIPSAAAAMRLGASDYIPKPFTPDEIVHAVERILDEHSVEGESDLIEKAAETMRITVPVEWETTAIPVQKMKPDSRSESDLVFFDDGWMNIRCLDSVRIGAFLSTYEGQRFTQVSLPQVGEKVYRGLPIAHFSESGKFGRFVPSPVTGEVIAINPELAAKPGLVWNNPCEDAWIAIVRPDRIEDDLTACKTRNVIVMTLKREDWKEQYTLLNRYGCQVHFAETYEEAEAFLANEGRFILFLDSASYGISGPQIVRKMNRNYPSLRTIVLRDKDNCREADYRMTRMFYYSVEPFADSEIIDILHNAFQPEIRPVRKTSASYFMPKWISRLNIVNRNRQSVTLLTEGNLLVNNEGLGQELVQRVLAAAYPLKINLSVNASTGVQWIDEWKEADKVIILDTEDRNRLPGTMMFDTEYKHTSGFDSNHCQTKRLTLQPCHTQDGALLFDERTNQALAEHILREMTT